MSDLRELYQDTILDHTRRPRNFGALPGATRSASGYNPLCGDKVAVHLELADGRVADVRFEGSGCAISTASASLMTEIVKGKSVPEARDLFQRFHEFVTAPPDASTDLARLGKLAVMGGVREFPIRVKCATLAWHTLRAALEGEADFVTAE